ncbi:hypothetical protein ABEW34_29925 [Paenibacillus algorifonticola]
MSKPYKDTKTDFVDTPAAIFTESWVVAPAADSGAVITLPIAILMG